MELSCVAMMRWVPTAVELVLEPRATVRRDKNRMPSPSGTFFRYILPHPLWRHPESSIPSIPAEKGKDGD